MLDPRMQTHYDRTGQTATTGGGHPERIDKDEPTVGPDMPSGVGSANPPPLAVEVTDEDVERAWAAYWPAHEGEGYRDDDARMRAALEAVLPSVLARVLDGWESTWAMEIHSGTVARSVVAAHDVNDAAEMLRANRNVRLVRSYRSPWVHDPGKEREIRDGS